MKENKERNEKMDSIEFGTCPFCKSKTLDYQNSGLEDEYYVYYWKCETCGCTGEEWNKIIFEGYENVITATGKKFI